MILVDNDVNKVHRKFPLDTCLICLELFPAIRCYYSDWFSYYLIYDCQVHLDYGNNCLKCFPLLFLSLLTTKLFKKSNILARIYFLFLKSVLKKLEIILIPTVDLGEKIGKTFTKCKVNFRLFFN